jgi:hypothetical protein
MNIPNFVNTQIVDSNGNLTDGWRVILMQLFKEMIVNLSNEGFHIPHQSQSNINKLTNAPSGTVIYNTTTNKLMVKEGTIFKTISTV